MVIIKTAASEAGAVNGREKHYTRTFWRLASPLCLARHQLQVELLKKPKLILHPTTAAATTCLIIISWCLDVCNVYRALEKGKAPSSWLLWRGCSVNTLRWTLWSEEIFYDIRMCFFRLVPRHNGSKSKEPCKHSTFSVFYSITIFY